MSQENLVTYSVSYKPVCSTFDRCLWMFLLQFSFHILFQLIEVLEQDPVSVRMQLSAKLGTVITAMEGPTPGRQAFV